MAMQEPGPVTIVFNGDFHWFDADPRVFQRIDERVAEHTATQGNVEAELAAEESEAGCGCAYPDSVDQDLVDRSNAILRRLRETAFGFPACRRRLASLPMHLRATVGSLRLAIVHGDADTLAGWRFAEEALDDPDADTWLAGAFRTAKVDLFASSHTCTPVFRTYGLDGRVTGVINNGAAGMPNFAGNRFGVLTRIGIEAPPQPSLYGLKIAGTRVDAMPIRYDAARFADQFLAVWPPGTPAHDAYWPRIDAGTSLYFGKAVPRYRELAARGPH
jgi:hypothetical protein